MNNLLPHYTLWYNVFEDIMMISFRDDTLGRSDNTQHFHFSPYGEAYTANECVLEILEGRSPPSIDNEFEYEVYGPISNEKMFQVFPPLDEIAAAFPGAKSVIMRAIRPHNFSGFSACRVLNKFHLESNVQVDLSGMEYLDTLVSLTIVGYKDERLMTVGYNPERRTFPIHLDQINGLNIKSLFLKFFDGVQSEEAIYVVCQSLSLPDLETIVIDHANICQDVVVPDGCKVIYNCPFSKRNPLHDQCINKIRKALPLSPLTVYSHK